MQLPNWEIYCQGTNPVNALVFHMQDFSVWYSYKTPVAFQIGFGAVVVRENDWGPTTGKHLNAIDGGDKKSRIPGAQFEKMLDSALTHGAN